MCGLPARIVIFAVSCVLLNYGYSGYKNGKVRIKSGRIVSREESPINYWVSVVTYLVAGLGGVLLALFR